MSSRDDFSQTTKNLLATQVALLCSFPGCGALTQGPHTNSEKRTNVGVAAHICAAAPGGPRYDPNMSKAERKSPENGIWMCHTHGTLIDSDYQKYSVAELHRWKKDAIARAETGVGRKLITEAEAQQQGMSLVAQFAQGTLGSEDSSTLIRHIHHSATSAMEKKDPRFRVTSEYSDEGGAKYTLHARETAALVLELPTSSAADMDLLHKVGKPVQLSAGSFNIKGSELFDDISKTRPALYIAPQKRQADMILTIIDDNGVDLGAVDINGHVQSGSEGFVFSGHAFGRHVSFQFHCNTSTNQAGFDLTTNLALWEGMLISRLGYQSKLHKFLKMMHDGRKAKVILEYEGEPYLSAQIDYDAEFSDLLSTAKYLAAARYLSEKTHQPIYFQKDKLAFDFDGLSEILNYEIILKTRRFITKEDLRGPIKINILFNEKNRARVEEYLNGKVKSCIELEEGITLEIMGQELSLPPKRTLIQNVVPVTKSDIASIRDGEEIEIELVPQDDFSITIEFTEEPS